MPVWRTTLVEDQPEVRLADWAIMELPDGDRHFVGRELGGDPGRVSSKIETFDRATMRGVTRSGRVYALVGSSGLRPDAIYVWNQWCAINKIDASTDVSDQFE